MNTQQKQSLNGYGKRPLWQWIIFYVIVGGLIYALIYYFIIAKHGGYGSTTYRSPSTNTTVPTNSSVIYTLKTDASHNTYLADAQGRALYVYDGDTAGSGTSTCTGTCATNWPPYIYSAAASPNLSAAMQVSGDLTIITRSDNTRQFAWKGKPLYYFVGDTQAGQTTGDGVNGFHLAR